MLIKSIDGSQCERAYFPQFPTQYAPPSVGNIQAMVLLAETNTGQPKGPRWNES